MRRKPPSGLYARHTHAAGKALSALYNEQLYGRTDAAATTVAPSSAVRGARRRGTVRKNGSTAFALTGCLGRAIPEKIDPAARCQCMSVRAGPWPTREFKSKIRSAS